MVECRLHIPFSFPSLGTKVSISASCTATDKLNKANMDSDYVTEEDCGARARELATKKKEGKEDSRSPNTTGA